jgi:hypothetical protein
MILRRDLGGYAATLFGVILLIATAMIGNDWTPLRGATRVVATTAAFAGSGAAFVLGWRMLRLRDEP